ncbi:endonuclease SmrB, partial [Glaesserella parasuis]|nr:endonuclease SmrB [Glaesserella parasuis]MDE3983471.1 endonuclease SmrB [Glaesserella parasuis]MDE3984408.1 endonuclease SmrB [Glaesserella parasuis]MDE4004014.1 endonuclease SmrB [Glaesserella parasuis]MDE4028228.1 endonuclease SmrB [Glaesserella parasuis]
MLENDELALFREAIKGTKKIKQDTFVPKVEPRKKINEIRELK